MRYSDEALEETIVSEGEKLEAYQDTGGVWTIGVGHTKGVKKGDKITKAQSRAYLREDMLDAERAVWRLVKVPLTQGQYDALVDFTFNLGEGALSRSTLLRLLNAKNYEGAALEFSKWVYDNHKVQPGLVTRRKRNSDRFRK
jgi:lysozyme